MQSKSGMVKNGRASVTQARCACGRPAQAYVNGVLYCGRDDCYARQVDKPGKKS